MVCVAVFYSPVCLCVASHIPDLFMSEVEADSLFAHFCITPFVFFAASVAVGSRHVAL